MIPGAVTDIFETASSIRSFFVADGLDGPGL
jgi:hypothetical protein